MNLIKPKKLKKGDTIGLLSVSGDIKEPEKIEKAKKYFEANGFNVVISDTTYKQNRYLAGTDEERLNALHTFFSDKNIDAIVCTRGGYGVIRILHYINYDLIRQNPKVFVGYSDITALLAMIYKKTGLLTFHGAMANGDFGEDEISTFTESSFFDALQDYNKGSVINVGTDSKTYFKGKSQGILWGGNLATLSSLAGQNFIPDEKFILFLEDINEPVYKIDRMFTQLLNIQEFKKNLVGMAIGKFTKVDREDYLDEFLKEISKELQIPICNGLMISHEKDKLTLPIGAQIEFDANNALITILEDILA